MRRRSCCYFDLHIYTGQNSYFLLLVVSALFMIVVMRGAAMIVGMVMAA